MRNIKLCLHCEDKIRDGYQSTPGFSLKQKYHITGGIETCEWCGKTFRGLDMFEFDVAELPEGKIDGTCMTCLNLCHKPDEMPCAFCVQGNNRHRTDVDFYLPNDD